MTSKIYVADADNTGIIDLTTYTGLLKGTPFFDGSTALIEMGMRCANGEASQGTFKLMDPLAQVPTATFNIPPHKLLTWSEDAPGPETWLTRGRIATYDGGREGNFEVDDYVGFDVTVDDGNIELRGQAFTEEWVRPSETGVARVLALGAYTLAGVSSTATNHRDTCEVTVNTSHLVPNTLTTTMPAKTYPPGTQPQAVIQDCADTENKIYSVVIHHDAQISHLCLLYIANDDHTTYASPVKISDHLDDWDPTDATAPVYEPHWEMGKASLYDGQQMITGIISEWNGQFIFAEHAPTVITNDYWVESYSDASSVSLAQAQQVVNALINQRRLLRITHRASIIVEASQVDLVAAGMSLEVRAAAIHGGTSLDDWLTRRIVECRFEPRIDGRYWAHLHLNHALRRYPDFKGNINVPRPPTPPTEGGCNRFYFSDTNNAVEPAASAVWNTDSADGNMQLTTSPDSTFVGSGSGETASAGGSGNDVRLGQFMFTMDAATAAVIAAGNATVRMQARARSRYGIGISEAAQDNISQIVVRVTEGATTTIRGTAYAGHSLANSNGSSKWAAQATHVNRVFPPAAASNVLSAVSGAAANDRLVVEVGYRSFTVGTTGAAVQFTSAAATDLPEDELETANLNAWLELCTADTQGDTPSPIGNPGEEDPGTPGCYAPCDHVHAHGFLADDDIHMHDADQIDGLEELDITGFVTTTLGGQEVVSEVAATGATETIDLADANWHELTLDTDCTITVQGFTDGVGCTALVKVRQDGTGGHAVTWDADIVFAAGADDQPAQDPDAVSFFLLVSNEGDSVIYGFPVGGGGAAVAALDDLTDVTITAPAEGDMLRYDGAVWVNTPGRWEPATDGVDTFVWDGDDIVMAWKDT